MVAAPKVQSESFFAALAGSKHKLELIDNQIVPMAGGSLLHDDLIVALFEILMRIATPPDVRIQSGNLAVAAGVDYYFPDLTLVKGQRLLTSTIPPALTNPHTVFEVLSPSTATYDRGRKLHSYSTIPSLHQYVLISQERVAVETYTRQPDPGDWLYHAYTRPDALVPLAGLDAAFRLDDLYAKTGLLQPPTAQQQA